MISYIPFFIIGIIIGGAAILVFQTLRNKHIALKWYEWLVGAIGLSLALMAIQHYFGAMAEGYPYAAWVGSLIIGIPAIILFILVFQLVRRHSVA
ncbi:dehalogenase [Dehalococcoides mccartyi CG4]|nr:dehalogenase [Dehalococcoides mccartyi CG4]